MHESNHETEPSSLARRSLLRGAGLAGAGAAAMALIPATAWAGEGNQGNGKDGAKDGGYDPRNHPIPEQAPAQYGQAPVPGGHLAYWDTGGRGPAVVLSHPSTGSMESWPYQQPVLAKAGFRVIGYSRRGHIGSSPNTPTSEATQPVASDDLRLLLDHLGLHKVHLLSAAYGGYFATDFALSYPDRVQSLLVLSSFMGIIDPDYLTLTNGLRPDPFNSMPAYFKELSPSYRTTNREGVAAWRVIVDRSLVPGSSFLHRMANQLTWARLEQLRVRTMLITGAADLYMPPPVMQMIAGHIKNVSTLVYPEVGHSANWETPRLFNDVAVKFLSR